MLTVMLKTKIMKTKKKIRSLDDFQCSSSGLLHFKKVLHYFMVLFTTAIFAQDPPQYGTPFAGVPDTRDVNMYQVHIRPFSAAGNLAGVTARLDNIKALGTNVIYLMPVFPHGTDAKSSPSPYCIKDFKAVGSEYGTLADLRTLVDGAHSRGMAVMLDIAINGTSWDHAWTTQHPEYYMKNGNNIQQLANFSDIAALDLNHAGLRDAIKDAMRYWILAANIDGYRCDFANNPPLDFWSEIIGNIRGISSHKLLMLAEGDRQANFTAGFDMNFGDRWYWNALKDVASGGPVSQRFQTINDYEYVNATGSNQSVRYTGNHDTYTNDNGEQRPFTIFKTHDGIVANFLVSAYMKGVPFLMSGQEIDYEPKTDWPWTNFKFNWSQNPNAAADFTKILNFRTSSTAIRRGNLAIYSSDDISAFTKTSGSEKVVVMANLRNASKTFVIPSTLAGTYKDAYSGANVTLTAGTTQSFSAFQYLVLTNSNVGVVAVTGISVSPSNATIGIGASQQLSVAVLPTNATNQNITWTSSNAAVATVNSGGLISGLSAGTTIITVKTADGNKTATTIVTVNAIAVSSVSVSPNNTALNVGTTQQLNATVSPADATNKSVNWTSSNIGVATVNGSGLVNAIAAGTTTITAKTVDGNKASTATITVNGNSSFTVNFYKPNNWDTGIKIYWWGASPAGTLDDASWPGVNMTNLGNGWYSYTFSNIMDTNLIFNDGSAQTANLSRNKMGWYQNNIWYDNNPGTTTTAVSGVSLSPTSASLIVGATQQVTANVSPSNANNITVSYSSNNNGVASINGSGVVSAHSAGTAIITVTTQDGSKTATMSVTVSTPNTGGGTYYTIKNRWKETYLYDAGATIGYGTTIANDAYKWEKIATDGIYFVLKNKATGQLAHLENLTGSVECDSTNAGWWSAQWSADYIDGTWTRIRSRWQTANIMHVESQNGAVQYTNSQDGWFSAQWQIQAIGTGKTGVFFALKTNASVDEAGTAVSIYPNPSTNGYFIIDFPSLSKEDITTATVYDNSGKVVLTKTIVSSEQINYNLPSGMYMVLIQNKVSSITKKLIVK